MFPIHRHFIEKVNFRSAAENVLDPRTWRYWAFSAAPSIMLNNKNPEKYYRITASRTAPTFSPSEMRSA